MPGSYKILPNNQLNVTGQVFEGLFKHAWKLFRGDNFAEAAILAQRLVVEPQLGDTHRAGMHLLLADSEHCYLSVMHCPRAHTRLLTHFHGEHATEALRLYEGSPATTSDEQESKDWLVRRARDALRRAEQDEAVRTEQAEELSGKPGEEEIEEEEAVVDDGIHVHSPDKEEADFPYDYDGNEAQTMTESLNEGPRRRPANARLNANTEDMMTELNSEPDLEPYLYDFPETAGEGTDTMKTGDAFEITQHQTGKEVDQQIPTPASASDAPVSSDFRVCMEGSFAE